MSCVKKEYVTHMKHAHERNNKVEITEQELD